jgi:DNA-binding transcriptional MerR regulator
MGNLIDIGEVRARTGLPASTLHYYERNGLIRSAERAGLRRQYEADTIQRLAVIVLCQRGGFSLEEITGLLATGGEPAWKDLVQAKLAQLRSQIRSLRSIERGLTHALACPSDNVLRCEHFRAELDAVIPVDPHRNRLLSRPLAVTGRSPEPKKPTP